MKRGKFLDLVIAGPDMSGTSTQIKDTIDYFQNKKFIVKDLRGTETDALFHSKVLYDERIKFGEGDFFNLRDYIKTIKDWRDSGVTMRDPVNVLFYINELLSGGGTNQDLRVASMVENRVTTYIDPNSADVWIMEEPTKRGAGQVNRVLEQNRSLFGDKMNPIAAALCHQVYRSEEALRFRIPLRENNKVIIRSRSEESACYQIYDKNSLQIGIKIKDYLGLPGHSFAFKYAPTNIFVVSGPKNWTTKDYLELKKQRSDGRDVDDHESNPEYQVLVNKRYATNWLENLYEKGCKLHGGTPPKITRFDIYDSKEQIREKMQKKLEEII